MPQKNIALLIILSAAVLALSISGKLNTTSSRPAQYIKPKITKTQKPNLLPLDSPVSIIKEIKEFLSPSPEPQTPLSSSVSASESFESVEKLQQSLNISLDLTGGIPFGGRVLDVQSCDSLCFSPYDMITVGPPVGGTFLVGPTTIYREYDYSVGNWVLGLANGFGVCLVLAFDECVSIGAGPVVDIMGTSN
ncbi:MAG: hypothetical protein AAB584_01125 [Patescibacteria group bacterium]